MTRHSLRLELFFDIVSPYSYLALVCLERYVPHWSLELVLRPAFLGGVMKAVENQPPASLPARAPYLLRDIARLSRAIGVAMTLPEPFPGQTLGAMRLLKVVEERAPSLLKPLTFSLYERHWGRGLEVQSDEALREALAAARVPDAEALLASKDAPEIKARLKASSDEAVARGAFGFPAMFVRVDGDDALYFGQDRLWLLAHDLGLPWHGPHPPPVL